MLESSISWIFVGLLCFFYQSIWILLSFIIINIVHIQCMLTYFFDYYRCSVIPCSKVLTRMYYWGVKSKLIILLGFYFPIQWIVSNVKGWIPNFITKAKLFVIPSIVMTVWRNNSIQLHPSLEDLYLSNCTDF